MYKHVHTCNFWFLIISMKITIFMGIENALLANIQIPKVAFIYSIVYISVFLISSPLTQKASYLALYSSLFASNGTVNYDYIVTNSINSLLIGSKCNTNGTHTNHC